MPWELEAMLRLAMRQIVQQQAVPVSQFREVTIYAPGAPPFTVPAERINLAGIDPQSGHSVVVYTDEDGQIVQFIDVPCRIVRAQPSGLVVPPPRRVA